jgi:hypothetical protein
MLGSEAHTFFSGSARVRGSSIPIVTGGGSGSFVTLMVSSVFFAIALAARVNLLVISSVADVETSLSDADTSSGRLFRDCASSRRVGDESFPGVVAAVLVRLIAVERSVSGVGIIRSSLSVTVDGVTSGCIAARGGGSSVAFVADALGNEFRVRASTLSMTACICCTRNRSVAFSSSVSAFFFAMDSANILALDASSANFRANLVSAFS